MSRVLRMVLLGSGLAALAFAAAFFIEASWATRLWPYQYGSLAADNSTVLARLDRKGVDYFQGLIGADTITVWR